MKQRIVGNFNYQTVEGDMFDSISLSAYNEERMATYIIAANPDYCDVVIFEAGIILKIPILESVETPATLPPWRRSI